MGSAMRSSKGVTPLAIWAREHMRIRNKHVVNIMSEFLGTFIICLFAVGSGAQYRLMPNESYMMPVLGGVSALVIVVGIFGNTSAHVNPAVTLAMAVAGFTNWLVVPFYWLAQMFGGYLGAGVAYAIYKHRLCVSEDEICKEAVGIFSPLPSSPVGTVLLDQTVTTAILLIFLFAVIDTRNMKVPKHLIGIYFAAIVAGNTFAFGRNAGGVLNPARDLAPRLMAVTLGHSIDKIFMNGAEHYWLGTLFGPLLGGVLGTFVYIFCVGSHLDDTTGTEDDDLENVSEKTSQSILNSDDWGAKIPIPTSMGINPQLMSPTISTKNPYCIYSGYVYNNGLNSDHTTNPTIH